MKIPIKNTYQYLQVMNGLFRLTDTEMQVLASFIDLHEKTKHSGIETNMFSTDIKKQVAKLLNREDFNTLNNYIKRMHDKKAIVRVVGGYKLSKHLDFNRSEGKHLELQWVGVKGKS